MTICMYDRVLLKDGSEASIVEIFEKDDLFLADIDKEGGTETEPLKVDEIEKVLKRHTSVSSPTVKKQQ